MSRTWRTVPQWSRREAEGLPKNFVKSINKARAGIDGAVKSYVGMPYNTAKKGYDRWELHGSSAKAWAKRRTAHIMRRRGAALTIKLIEQYLDNNRQDMMDACIFNNVEYFEPYRFDVDFEGEGDEYNYSEYDLSYYYEIDQHLAPEDDY